jgi:hypothetical protein
MAEGVVDDLEAVKIQEHHADFPSVAAGFRQQLGESHVQRHAIRQTGQRIMLGDVPHAFLGLLAFGDVGEDPDVMRGLAAFGVIYAVDPDTDRKTLAVFSGGFEFVVPGATLRDVFLECFW